MREIHRGIDSALARIRLLHLRDPLIRRRRGLILRAITAGYILPGGETAASIIFTPATRHGAVGSPRIQFRGAHGMEA